MYCITFTVYDNLWTSLKRSTGGASGSSSSGSAPLYAMYEGSPVNFDEIFSATSKYSLLNSGNALKI